MIDWESPEWGGNVHEDPSGSWLRGAHGEEQDS